MVSLACWLDLDLGLSLASDGAVSFGWSIAWARTHHQPFPIDSPRGNSVGWVRAVLYLFDLYLIENL